MGLPALQASDVEAVLCCHVIHQIDKPIENIPFKYHIIC